MRLNLFWTLSISLESDSCFVASLRVDWILFLLGVGWGNTFSILKGFFLEIDFDLFFEYFLVNSFRC